jgi:tripartite-type tricarboxylate transporter receptor subunit TctC
MVPAGVPAHIVAKLNNDIVQALRSPEVLSTFEKAGAEIVGGTPEEFARFIRNEIQKWAKVVSAAGITPE